MVRIIINVSWWACSYVLQRKHHRQRLGLLVLRTVQEMPWWQVV